MLEFEHRSMPWSRIDPMLKLGRCCENDSRDICGRGKYKCGANWMRCGTVWHRSRDGCWDGRAGHGIKNFGDFELIVTIDCNFMEEARSCRLLEI